MKALLGVGCIILAGILSGQGLADGNGPEVLNIDQKISIHADDITLGHLLQLWDQATGMQSTIRPDLADRKLSVRFTGLDVSAALRRIFNGLPFDYILAEGQLLVTASRPIESAAEPEPDGAPADADFTADNDVSQEATEPSPADVERLKPELLPPPEPKYIPTPFGPIVSPTWNQPFIQLPPVQVAPPPPFFAPEFPPTPPAGAPNGPVQNNLFGPLPVYRGPN